MKPDLRADYKIRLYTDPKKPFFEVSIFPHRCEVGLDVGELAFRQHAFQDVEIVFGIGLYYVRMDIAIGVKAQWATIERLAAQLFGAQRLTCFDWVNDYINLQTCRDRTLYGIFVALAADATPEFRARLIAKISEMDA